MAEADLDPGEQVGQILQEIGGKLPEADFVSDEEDSENEGGLTVFSRSRHLKVVGFDEASIAVSGDTDAGEKSRVMVEKEMEGEERPPSLLTPMLELEPASVAAKTREKSTSDDSGLDDSDWTKFKTEFTEKLQTSEDKINTSTLSSGEPFTSPSAFRQQVIIDAITSLHSAGRSQEGHKGQSEINHLPPTFVESPGRREDDNNDRSEFNHEQGMISPSSNKSVLALETFESISETSLDHVLTALGSSGRPTGDDGGASNSAPPPAPKLAWPTQSDTGNETLMEELEKLSVTQSSRTQCTLPVMDERADRLSQESHSSRAPLPGADKPTVFLDLRPSTQPLEAAANHTSRRGLSALGKMKRESTSDSEEDTDPFSWIAERKQLKGKLESQTLSSIISNHSNANHQQRQLQHNLHHSRKLNVINSGAQTAKTVQDISGVVSIAASGGKCNENVGERNHGDKQSPGTSQQVGVASTAAHQTINGPQVDSKAVIKAANTRERTKAGSQSKQHKPLHHKHAVGNGIDRQRSSDSFTLSSSLSEGEGPSSEGTTSHGEDHRTQSSSNKDNRSSQSSLKGKKSSKKQSKKSKKTHKKDKGQGGQSSSTDQQSRSKKISKRRAYVLERIRNDSLTSSDDEHSLASSDVSSSTDSGRSSLLHQDSILEDGDSAIIDVEKVKLHLQRRIMAKKPPSQFETPSTQPVFHEEISFERELMCIKPDSTPSALLVVQVCEHGLIAPPEMFSEIDMSAKLGFHLLLLTWLFRATVSTKSRQLANSEGNATSTNMSENGEETSVGDLPFEIVSIQYTILDGNPSYLIGVSVRGERDNELHRMRSGGSDAFSEIACEANQLEAYFQQTPLSVILSDIISNDAILKLLSPAAIEQIKAILNSPLETVFSFQDDVSPLSTPVSFFWHSGYHPSCLPSSSSLKTHSPLTTTVCSVGAVAGSNIELVFSILSSVYLKGLDVAGLRLVYGEACGSIEASLAVGDESDANAPGSAMLVLAVRGPDSIYKLMDIIGPKDESLAKVTDPHSLTALYGSELTSDLHCLRTPYSAAAALAKYFGGRACVKSGSIIGISDAYTRHERKKRQRVRFSESESAAEDLPPSPLLDISFSPLVTNRQRLIAEPYTKVVVVVSPHVPTSCYSTVLACCDKQGFDVFGLKRLRLNSKRANALNIPPSFLVHFTPSSTPPSPVASEFFSLPLVYEHTQAAPPLPSCLLILGRENALLHTLALKAALVSDLVGLLKCNPSLQESSNLRSLVEYVDALFHVTEHSQELLKYLGHFGISSTVSSNQPKLGSGWDMEDIYQDELCFVAVPQSDSLSKATHFLDKVSRVNPVQSNDRLCSGSPQNDSSISAFLSSVERDMEGGFELLGFKVVPELPRFHAKQLCPLSSGDPQHQQAINLLSDVPATLLLFRGIGSNHRLQAFSTNDTKSSPIHTSPLKEKLQIIVSSGFQDAYRLANIFFSDKELFSDLPSWALSSYVPLSWHQDSNILHRLQLEQEQLFSVVTVPMCRMKTAVKVMDKLSRSGCTFVGIATMAAEEEEFEEVIHIDNHEALSSEGPMIVLCVQRVNAVWHVQHILKSFTDFQSSKSHLYCSGEFNAAISDIKHYFPSGVLCDPCTLVADYGLTLEAHNNFDHLLLPEGSLPPSDSTLGHYLSPLTETNVMVLPPRLVKKDHNVRLSTAGCVEVLDFLSAVARFHIIGLKMVQLSLVTAGTLHAICCDSDSTTQVQDLTSGPSLVVMMRRDNAVACCQMIIKSALQSMRGGGDSLNDLMKKVVFPTDATKAKQVLELFCIRNA